MARVGPRREAFRPSLSSADMNALCGGDVSLSADDELLASSLAESAWPGLAGYMGDERVRRLFWGLGAGEGVGVRAAAVGGHTEGIWGGGWVVGVERGCAEGVWR